jgi:hypothetical protein
MMAVTRHTVAVRPIEDSPGPVAAASCAVIGVPCTAHPEHAGTARST